MIACEVLQNLLEYNPETGKLFWIARPVSMFGSSKYGSAEAVARTWNSQNAGKEAFTSTTCFGYRQGCILGRRKEAHRVIWALHYGEWPTGEIDHVNGVRDDNRIANLRHVSRAGNQRNKKRQANNTSGAPGIYFDKPTKSWRAQITVNRVRMHIGLYATFDEAVAARKAAEARYGFHENHGRAA